LSSASWSRSSLQRLARRRRRQRVALDAGRRRVLAPPRPSFIIPESPGG
jgi:hypothetical protein